MEIRALNRQEYAGREFQVSYSTKTYLDIEKTAKGFDISKKEFEEEKSVSFRDRFFAEWLEDPVAYGFFEGTELAAFAEGSMESWNKRFRISNICVFDSGKRRKGLGSILMDTMLAEAKKRGARMAVLETQSCNEKAIAFYTKMGFEIIGFDLYSYSNEDPALREIRLELGKKL